jgi:hypothetical protein
MCSGLFIDRLDMPIATTRQATPIRTPSIPMIVRQFAYGQKAIPTSPPSAATQARQSMNLWSIVDQSIGNETSSMQHAARILALRVYCGASTPPAETEAWRSKVLLWESDDRNRFDQAMQLLWSTNSINPNHIRPATAPGTRPAYQLPPTNSESPKGQH